MFFLFFCFVFFFNGSEKSGLRTLPLYLTVSPAFSSAVVTIELTDIPV